MSEFSILQLIVANYFPNTKFLRSLVGGSWVYWESRKTWILLSEKEMQTQK